jgi:tetratricopeptide (TPR) repeat protein
MRIAAQLIEAENGRHVWAERFERDGADMFALQDEITTSITASVQTQIILNEGKRALAGAGAINSPARLLARSWEQFLRLTSRSLAECRSLAERALEIDGKSGMAHRMIAVALYHQAYMGFIPWTQDVVDQIYAHAKISIEADDADEYSHWAMECAHLFRKEHERAAAALRRALEINPNCSLAHGSMGTVLAWSGSYDEAVRSNEFAIRINPDDPSIFYRHLGLALAHYLASRYDRALEHARAVMQARPDWWLGVLLLSAALGRLGRREEAGRALDDLRRLRAGTTTSSLDMLPFANRHDREHFLEGLREAGLPD